VRAATEGNFVPPGVSALPPAKECSNGLGSKARCGGAGRGAVPRVEEKVRDVECVARVLRWRSKGTSILFSAFVNDSAFTSELDAKDSLLESKS
jgi:hypothetical protein